MAKRLAADKSDARKSLKERFFKLASRLHESEKPEERRRLKKSLVCTTFRE